MHKTTLEQWSLLESVVELGSFARTADAMYRSQSSVSYNLAQLQERLGVTLLTLEGRRAVLTPAGRLLLDQAKPLLAAFHALESRAADLHNGARGSIDLIVDTVFPRQRLFAILREFQQRHPATQVRLTEVLESDPEAIAASKDADVLVLTRREESVGRGEWLMNVDFVAVAHHEHPLHQLASAEVDEALSRYPQIRIAGREREQAARESRTSEQWTFSTADAAIEAVMYQVGYGWLPQERIQAQLAAGTLKALPLAHGARRATPLHLIVKEALSPPDEQVATLLALFKANREA
ncbi:MAG TPA: LysR family transcriptional regulator [Franconibacter helveticus]|uniref:LysR family transcriptional regulator n=1 Tax=Franconibacter helveticus TaxID=357240 RepID=UPI000404C0FE|nr:LysR family transcriptional regulator [Franconibacter helveticus]MDU6924646.1 LysR family transcriptional regulator [Franconibacter helveticus]HAZ53850.1 LysR family transcriptional regulator [Franconibacter helveticus]